MRLYILTVLCGVSVLVNAIAGGEPFESVSYRSAKARRKGKRWGCVLCRVLDLIDRDHCTKSIDWHEDDFEAKAFEIAYERLKDEIAIRSALERR